MDESISIRLVGFVPESIRCKVSPCLITKNKSSIWYDYILTVWVAIRQFLDVFTIPACSVSFCFIKICYRIASTTTPERVRTSTTSYFIVTLACIYYVFSTITIIKLVTSSFLQYWLVLEQVYLLRVLSIVTNIKNSIYKPEGFNIM